MKPLWVRLGIGMNSLTLVCCVWVLLFPLHNHGRRGDARKSRAITAIKAFTIALDMYREDVGHYPPQAAGLLAMYRNVEHSKRWRGPYLRAPNGVCPLFELRDPWMQRYEYLRPGPNGESFQVSAQSPDGDVIANPPPGP